MRVLFTGYPLLGHVNPMLPLALAARRAGHEVVFATGPDLSGHVERFGLTTWRIGPTHAQAAAAIPPSLRFFTETAPARVDDLRAATRRWEPELVVADEFELAGPLTARLIGSPFVVHGLGLMIPRPIWEPIEQAIEELHARRQLRDGIATVRRALYLEAAPPSLRPGGERTWARSQPLRPTPGPSTGGDRLPGGLDALPHERTIHLTLGTLFHDRLDVLATAIEGLRELDANLVVTVGPGIDPGRLGRQPAHVLLAPYLPHQLLLRRCDLVVSQGGAGIMLGALAHGIPQLMLPQGADQFLNADVCVRAGAARALQPDQLTADAVAVAANMLLTDPAFATAACRVGDELQAMPDPDAVASLLLQHVRRPPALTPIGSGFAV
ncbi:MAG: glycosyltransferase [Gaiellales bacterium]